MEFKLREFRINRPKKICGLSRSEFKRVLNQRGHKTARNFWERGFSTFDNRAFRWRFTTGEVDVSCPLDEFDRWANSTDDTITIEQFLNRGVK